jgi:lipoprotein-releasing system permease protein
VASQTKRGSFNALQPGAYNIVLGIELARTCASTSARSDAGAGPGQPTPAGVLPRVRTFTVVGIFEAGHNEFDSALAFVHLTDAEKLLRIDAGRPAPAPAGHAPAPQVAQELKNSMPGDLFVRDWSKLNANWFAAVQTEKRMMFIILTLIIAVAAFNLVSTLVMTVTDKQADIAILRTLGASPRSIMKIFMIQGALVGILGT